MFNVYLYLQEMQLVPVIEAISAEDPQISQLLAQTNMYVSELVDHFNNNIFSQPLTFEQFQLAIQMLLPDNLQAYYNIVY